MGIITKKKKLLLLATSMSILALYPPKTGCLGISERKDVQLQGHLTVHFHDFLSF